MYVCMLSVRSRFVKDYLRRGISNMENMYLYVRGSRQTEAKLLLATFDDKVIGYRLIDVLKQHDSTKDYVWR